MKQVLAISHARKSYDGKVDLDDVTLGSLPGAKIGVVGPNGMGKSTLLRMMAGLEQPSKGEVRLMPGYGVGILSQEPALDEGKTVLGNVEGGVAGTRALIERYKEVAGEMAAGYSDGLLEELGRLQEQLDHRDAWDLDSQVEQAMDALRCPPPDAERPDAGTIRVGETVRISYVDQLRAGIDADKSVWEVISGGEAFIRAGRAEIPSRAYVAAFGFKGSAQHKPAGLLSGGERGWVNLALTLKQGGNLLLLDEPANDPDVETLTSLEDALGEFPGCAVITSHDRWFLDRVATHILAWEGGADWFWFEGNFASYEKNKTGRLGDEAARPHRVTYRKLTRRMARERSWTTTRLR
jgi:ATPase subunit of ABC transporter with duplicated ATPase domains